MTPPHGCPKLKGLIDEILLMLGYIPYPDGKKVTRSGFKLMSPKQQWLQNLLKRPLIKLSKLGKK